MPNFPEPITPDFVPVYQIQRTDPVDAGAAGEGPSNLPIKNLVERTAYLKKEVEDLDTTLGGVVIGSTVQAYDADLQAIAALSTTGIIDRTGAGTATTRATGATGLAVLASANAAAARTAIEAAPLNNPSFTGNVGVGLTSTSRNNTSLQIVDGIGFPAIQVASTDANTLDDYEEGTWTPQLTDSAGAVVATFTHDCKYRKIGSFVFVTVFINITAIQSQAGVYAFVRLPFVPSETANGYQHGNILGYKSGVVGTGDNTPRRVLINGNTTNTALIAPLDFPLAGANFFQIGQISFSLGFHTAA